MDHSSGNDPDLDPLITRGAASIKPTNAKGLLNNRRDHRLSHLERWGRIRLVCLSMSLFFVIYICFSVGAWSDQRPQIIVRIPPNDDSLPGPKGLLLASFLIVKLFFT